MDKWGIKMVEFGPYEMEQGRMEWNYLPFPTSYCDLCEDRVNAGGIPRAPCTAWPTSSNGGR